MNVANEHITATELSQDVPLVVDLDGTLIHTDLLHEAILLLIKKNILYLFLLPVWLLRGKVFFKNKISSNVKIPAELLPYNKELLQFLTEESSKGRPIILATASPMSSALEVRYVHSLFKEVYGTDSVKNLKGKQKSKMLINLFGSKQFDYIGNSYSDLKVFQSCRYSYLINPSALLETKTRQISNLQLVWKSKRNSWKSLIKAIRPYQWIKNVLVFVPLVTAHLITSIPLVVKSLYAFIAFSVVASSGYLLNDLLDLNADRSHPRKKFRPVASGELSISYAVVSGVILFVSGALLAYKLSLLFLVTLLTYFVISVSYSLFLKRAVLYDVFVLASLYSIRVLAGGVAVTIELSFWLIAFSTFIFLSLAFVKRYSELMQVTSSKDGLLSRGREYFVNDLNVLQTMGIVSGFSAIIVFSLYINSPEVSQLYAHPKILWASSFLFLFWISRMWLMTIRGKMTDDPIIFAIKDITSYIVFLLIGIILFASI